MRFSISNGKTREQLQGFGISGDHIDKVFFSKKVRLPATIKCIKNTTAGLNYADECTVHEDELASIFSTKTPEYLGSDSLIVYHGPKHYFLAAFLLENDCGIVIDTRDESELLAQLQHIIEHYSDYEYKIKNAVNSLAIFNGDPVAQKPIKTPDV